MMQRRHVLGMVAVGALAGCGFRLRGQVSLPFRQLVITGVQGGVTQALQQALALNDVKVWRDDAAEASSASWRLQVAQDRTSRQVVGTVVSGRVREIELGVQFAYALYPATAQPNDEPVLRDQLELVQDMSYEESAALAKATEEATLLRDMQARAAQSVLRRLAAWGGR